MIAAGAKVSAWTVARYDSSTMPVRFVIGRAGTGKTHFLRERLVEHVRPDPLNAKVIYLVPRQTTFSTQRAIATDPRLNGYTGIRITSPDELAETALVETGRPAGARLDATGRALLIGHLLRQNAAELEHFSRSAGRPGLATEIDRTFGEFERAGQAPDEIAQIAENAGGGDSSRQQLGRKLRDLSRLYSNYQQFLIAHGLDPFQRQLSAPDAIASWPEAQGALVLVDEFYDYTVYERQVIAALAAVAGQTFISALFDAASPLTADANLNPDDLGLFLRTEVAYRRLHFTIALAKVPIDRPLLLSGGRRWKNPVLSAVSRALDPAPPAPVEPNDQVRLCLAADAHDELEVAAREIKRLLYQGYRLRDICVLARSADAYAAHIESAFTEHQIPYFVDRRRPAAHHPLVRTLQAIATIVQSRWSHDGVFDLLKAGLTGVASQHTDLLVDYVTQHRLTASAWAREEPWHYNRLDEDENRRLFSEPEVDIVNGVAERIRRAIGPLATPLDADTPKPIGVRVTDLINALERLDIRRAMQQRIEALDNANLTERREEEEQVWASWTDLCDRFHELLGEVELDGSEFFRLLQTSLDSLDLAVVPPTLDQVLVGSVDRTRVGEPKAVILIGLNECDFPLCQQERPVLNDADRVRLLEVGLEVEPPTRTALLSERFLGYIALTRASEKLILIRTECDDHGQDCAPSVFWEHVTKVLAKAKPEPRKKGIDRITTPTQAVAHLLSWASHQHNTIEASDDAALYQWMITATEPELVAIRERTWPSLRHRNAARLTKDTAEKLFPSPLEGSVSRFESFAACPFQHFARYGLRLQRPTASEFSAMDLGNLYHAVLDNMVSGTIKQKKDFATAEGLTPDEIRGVSRRLAESIGDQLFLSDARSRFTLDQLDRTVHKLLRAQQFTAGVGQLRPAHTELTFGPGNATLPPVELNTPAGHSVRLRGKIDRIDTDTERNTYSVIDYKLAGESLDYGYVARGLMLQLLTYLLVLQEHSGKLFEKQLAPAAVLYVRVLRGIAGVSHPDEAPEPETRDFLLKQKPRGVISSDWANVIDPTIAPGVPSEVINYKLKKDGEPYSSGHEGVEPGTLGLLIEYVRRQVAELADQIIAGEIAVAPYLIARETPCQTCDLHRVCRIDRSMNRYRVLNPLDQKEALAIIADPQGKGGRHG
jgi:ATP-dependent helicase/nuclease subunit B